MTQTLPTTFDALLELFQGSTPEELAKYAEVARPYLERPWIYQDGPQAEAYHSPADELLYGGAAGGGKALSVDEKVVTPFGFRRMGDLRVGDTVCAADGTPTKIIGVYPQGVRPLYRVRFQDGASVLADADHRWNYSVASRGWRKSGRAWKVGTTAQLANLLAAGARPLIPLCGPLKLTKAYKSPQRLIDPYVLGLLLGDGYTKQSGPGAKWSFASTDAELINALPGDWVFDSGCSYRLRGAGRERLLAEYERLGLAGCGAKTKFVPEPYKWAGVEDRRALLQGLMDTDGTNDDRGHPSFTSISRQLSDDVAWLVRSLGGRAAVTEKETGKETAYTVYIRVADSSTLFRLERKRCRGSRYQHGAPKRRIVSIEYEEDGEAVCIAVDHPDSLYVVGEGCVVTHNTDLILGLATTAHERSLIIRAQAKDLDGLWDRLQEIIPDPAVNNTQKRSFRTPDGRLIEGGHLDTPGSERSWQGRPHDLLAFDEAAQLQEARVVFLSNWVRSVNPLQRKRMVFATNPPLPEIVNGKLVTTGTGEWLKSWFAPWLEPLYPDPAKPGELRWCYMRSEGDRYATVWVAGPGYYNTQTGEYVPEPNANQISKGVVSAAKSRTYIPARVADNRYLAGTGYVERMSATPEPMRSMLLNGDFTVRVADDEMQIIPTAWVLAAQRRWQERSWEDVRALRQLVLAGDVAQGGADMTVLAALYETNYFEEPLAQPGAQTPTGVEVMLLLLNERLHNSIIALDGTGGWAGSTRDLMSTHHQIECEMHISSQSDGSFEPQGRFKYLNQRIKMWWEFRLALDPTSGYDICLPPGSRILSQLTAVHYGHDRTGKYLIAESKDEVRKRIGASTDEADAMLIAWQYREQALMQLLRDPAVDVITRLNRRRMAAEEQQRMRDIDDSLYDPRGGW